MPHTEWTSPRKMMDYYMDQSDVIEACEKRLYLAVINGEVRARLKGRVLGPEWLKQIAAMNIIPSHRIDRLSVQDAKKLWPL